MAEICPSQLALCPACGCPVGQHNILFKSLYVQVLNQWLSPCIYYPVPASQAHLWPPVPVPVSDITTGHKDFLLKDRLFGHASSV